MLVLAGDSLRPTGFDAILTEGGFRAVWMEDPAEAESAAASGGFDAAVVALTREPAPDAPILRTLRLLRGAGLALLVYGEGIGTWAVRARCLPLLAGASELLDAGRSGFAQEIRRWLLTFRQARAQRAQEERHLRDTMSGLGLVAESPGMRQLCRNVLRIANFSDLATLVTGETGTGKELVAQAIHALDPKRGPGPFVVLNCAALTPSLAESELFGHRRGAFTGAERERPGLIRAAHGGVLFLDEIGDLDLTLQAKLLRVLQANRVLRVGDEQEVAVSVRVIAATNRDLRQMVEQRTFRADLFHRLNVLSLHLPPLRERPEDIAPLVRWILARHAHLRPGWNLEVGSDFIEALASAPLPGNVRQLENLVCQALVAKDSDTPLHLNDLPPEFWSQLTASAAATEPPVPPVAVAPAATGGVLPDPIPNRETPWAHLLDEHRGSLTLCLQSCERALLAVALEHARGNQAQTARLLGISARSVYSKLRKYRLRSRFG